MPVAAAGDDAEVQRDVTQETIERYADLTGDENRLHTDPEYAAEGFFGGVVAHGMLGAGLISAALAALPGDIVYLAQDLDFEAPVTPGDTVRARVEVLEELGDDRVRVETVAEIVDDDSATTVIDGEATVLSVPHEE